MKRFIFKKTSADFYFEEMNLRTDKVENLALPVLEHAYSINDLITFAYGVFLNKENPRFEVQRTFKIDEILEPSGTDCFALSENKLIPVIVHYHDHTKDSKETQAETEVIEVR